MSFLSSLVQMSRPINGLLVFICVYTGAYLSIREVHEILRLDLFFIALITFIVTSAANIVNDYFDHPSDKINRPDRPIPSGRVSPFFALIFSVFLLLSSVYLGSFFSKEICFIVFFASFVSFFYSPLFKKIILIKNVSIGFNVALAFVCGSLIYGQILSSVIVSIFAFIISIYREILKDIFDCEGDKDQEVITLPIKFGKDIAWFIAFLFLLLLSLLVLYLSIFIMENYLFAILEITLVLIPLIYFSVRIKKHSFNQKVVLSTLRWSKCLFFVALMIFFVS